MKRYISTLALCALAFIGLNSCNKAQEVDLENGTRTVTFQVQMGPDTRTGLSVKFVPDWTDTKIANVHLFEDHKGNHMEGKNVKMEIDENNDEIAYFSADYTDEWTIIVDPTMPETRASATDYVYTGVVAQRTGEGDNAKYVVPDVQYPGKNTLIDPDADFLVGRAPEAYTSGQSLKQVDMIFKRPVSVSRLAIWGIPEGEKVQEVKIVSADKLTGSVALSGIDFENRTVEAFDETSGSTTITLNYGAGEAVPAEAFFNVYFISLPGEKSILSIEVTTDQKTYIKEFDGGKTLTFKTPDFKSIAVNMLDIATDDGKQERDLHFVKGQTTVTTDAYDIWDATNQTYADAYVAPTLAGTTEGATPVWNSSDQDVATVDAEGNVTIVGAGTTEITVFIASSDTYKSGNASFTLTVSDSTPAPQDQPLKFVKGGATITEDNTDIYPEVSYTTPTLEGAVSGATVSFEISCTPVGCATIATDGTVTPVAAGVAVITAKATAVAPLWNETTKSYTLTITDSTPAAGTTYYLVAKPEDVVAGKYLIVSAADAYIFDGTGTYQGGYTTIADAEDITLDSDKKTITINGETDAFDFTFAKSGNGFTITGEKGMIVADEHSGASTSTETYITFAETGGSVFLQRGSLENKPEALLFSTTRGTSSNEYLYYNTTNKIFKIGGSGSSNGIHLYFAGERAAQTVGFGEEEFTYDLAGEGSWSPSVPAVSGTYYTELVYASSNEEVIKYDKDNGWVFGAAAEKNATATVTVTAPASDQYLSATASFTVTIVDTTPAAETTYMLVTKVEDVVDGNYLVVSPDDTKIFDGSGTGKGGYTVVPSTGVAGDQTAGTITISNEKKADLEFSIDRTDNTLKLKKGSNYLAIDTGNSTSYIGFTSTGSTFTLDAGLTTAANKAIYFWVDKSGSADHQYLYYKNWDSEDTYKIGGSGDDATRGGVHLYFAGERAAQTVGFGEEEFTYDLAGEGSWSPSVPAVSGTYYTELVYASSNEEVIKYDKDNGWVFGTAAKKNATATVTVTAPASDQYLSATASFTVTIVDTTPGGDEPSSAYYQRVTASSEFVEDGVYVIVNESNSKLFKPVLNSTNSNFQTTNNTIDVTIADGKIASSSAVDACQIVLKNADGNGKFALFVPSVYYYLQVYNGSNFKADASNNEYRSTFSVTSAGVASIYRDNTHYIRYSGTNSAFQVGNNSDNIAVYKYVSEGGTTPEPPTNPTYTRIEGYANLVTGIYVITDKTDTYLLNASGTNNGGYSTIGTTSGVTKSDATITLGNTIAKAHEFVITRTGDNLTIQKVGGDHANQYLFASSSVSSSYMGFQSTAATFVIDKQEGTNYIFFSTTKDGTDPTEYLYKKSSDSFFKLGGSGSYYNQEDPTKLNADAGIYLYKKN